MIGNFWITYFWAHKETPPGSGNIVFCSGCQTETNNCGPCQPICFPCSGCPCLDGPLLGQQVLLQAYITPTLSNEVVAKNTQTCPTGTPIQTCEVLNSPYCCQEGWNEDDWYTEDCLWVTGLDNSYNTGNVAYVGLQKVCPQQPPFPCQQDPNPIPCGRESNTRSCCPPGCPTCGGGAGPACIKSECSCYACAGDYCTMEEVSHTLVGTTFVASSLYEVTGQATIDENGTPCGFSGTEILANTFHGVADGVPCGDPDEGLDGFGYAGMADENGDFFWNGMRFSGIPSTDSNPYDMQYNCPGTLFVQARAACRDCGPVRESGCDAKTTCGYRGPTPTGHYIGNCFTEIEALYVGDVTDGGVTYSQIGRYCRTANTGGTEIYRSGGEIVSELPDGYQPGINRGVITPGAFTIGCA